MPSRVNHRNARRRDIGARLSHLRPLLTPDPLTDGLMKGVTRDLTADTGHGRLTCPFGPLHHAFIDIHVVLGIPVILTVIAQE